MAPLGSVWLESLIAASRSGAAHPRVSSSSASRSDSPSECPYSSTIAVASGRPSANSSQPIQVSVPSSA